MSKISSELNIMLTPILGNENLEECSRVLVMMTIEPDKAGIWDVGDAIRVRVGTISNSAICWVPKDKVFNWVRGE